MGGGKIPLRLSFLIFSCVGALPSLCPQGLVCLLGNSVLLEQKPWDSTPSPLEKMTWDSARTPRGEIWDNTPPEQETWKQRPVEGETGDTAGRRCYRKLTRDGGVGREALALRCAQGSTLKALLLKCNRQSSEWLEINLERQVAVG